MVIPGIAGVFALTNYAACASLPVTGVLDLAEPVRATGLGGAGGAAGGDPALGGLNPAASAWTARPLVALAGSRGAFEVFSGQVLGARPLAGGVGSVSAAYLDAGRLAYTTPAGVTGEVAAQRDAMVGLAFARPVSRLLAVGAGLRLVQSELFETATARALVAELGVRARVLPWLAMGAAYRGPGGAMTWGDGDDWRLPSSARVGLAAEWASSSGAHAVTALADSVRSGTGAIAWHLGAEYLWRDLVTLRAGAAPAADGLPATFGGGFGVAHGMLRLDYGIRLGGPAAVPHALSLTIRL